jgi:hypothetical protein
MPVHNYRHFIFIYKTKDKFLNNVTNYNCRLNVKKIIKGTFTLKNKS